MNLSKNKKIVDNKSSIVDRKPTVSVLLPVHNEEPYLTQCLDSILDQTYKDFEVIAVDDASSDNTYKILLEYAEKYPKVKVFRNKRNKGVSETAKKTIKLSKGDYLARMDADDVILPNRLEKQLQYLRKNKETVAVGGQALIIDDNNNLIGKKVFPLTHEEVYKYIFSFIPVQQATIMIARKRLPKDFVYYVDGMNTAEEVELFFKLFKYGKVENLDAYVLFYRHHGANTSLANIRKTFYLTLRARVKAVIKHDYTPTISGVFNTVAQTIIVSILPQKFTLSLYKILRGEGLKSFITVSRTKLR